ncbi:MAG: SIS domain-containing protein, partial [Candidatus Latescibacterota bacterium]
MDITKLQKKFDKKGMLGLIENFPAQMEEAWMLAAEFAKTLHTDDYSRIVLCGMGGSAIAGDMVRSCLGGALEVPLYVSRSYDVPAHMARGALCIVSSYSGNTGETLLSYESLRGNAKAVIAITSGGKLEKICVRDQVPVCKIPGGMPPRAAIAYSFFPTLLTLRAAGLCALDEADLFAAKAHLEHVCSAHSIRNPDNHAVAVA